LKILLVARESLLATALAQTLWFVSAAAVEPNASSPAEQAVVHPSIVDHDHSTQWADASLSPTLATPSGLSSKSRSIGTIGVSDEFRAYLSWHRSIAPNALPMLGEARDSMSF
jgi:hypothetical protein